MLTTCRYEQQRKLDRAWVVQYARAMRQGMFRQATLVSFAVREHQRLLVNGQHTLSAIVAADLPYQLRIESVPVDDLQDVGILYGTYDQHRRRSNPDIYTGYNLAETLEMPSGNVNLLGAAMPLLMSGFIPYPMQHGWPQLLRDTALRARCITAWADEAKVYYELIRNCPSNIKMPLRRASVIAVALVTLRHTGTDAEEFWHMMAMGSGLLNNDPRMVLHHFLREKSAHEYPQHVYARYIAHAWNTAWRGKTVHQLRMGGEMADTAILILGTPHDGKQALRYITDEGEVLQEPVGV